MNALPQDWQERLGPALYDAVFLARHFPRRIDRALSMVEQGEISTEMRFRDIEHVLGALQRLVNRLVLGILSAGLIVGVALLLQVLHLQDLQWLLQVLLWTGLGAVLVTTAWLALHILRGQ